MAICRNIMKRIVFHTKWIKLINGRSHQSFLLCIKKQRAKGFYQIILGTSKRILYHHSFVFLIRCWTPSKYSPRANTHVLQGQDSRNHVALLICPKILAEDPNFLMSKVEIIVQCNHFFLIT